MSSSRKADLRVDWCTYEAAKYAVMHWHYSKRMPKSKLIHVGAWEGGTFVGAVVFGYGATPQIGVRYGLQQTEVAELVRVALNVHHAPTSRIVALAVRMVQRFCPGPRLLVSFADTNQGHVGTLYQACGWTYDGRFESQGAVVVIHGKREHPRSVVDRYGTRAVPWLRANVDPTARCVDAPPKHRHLLALDPAMRAQIAPLAKPYPKKPSAVSVEADTAPDQGAKGGASPTTALQPAPVASGAAEG